MRWPGSWHRKGTPRLCEIVTVNLDAEIDLDAALTALQAAAPPVPRSKSKAGSAATPQDWSELTGNIVAGKKLHGSIARLAARYVKSGMSPGAAVNQLRGLMDISAARQARPDEWRDRYADIPRAVETAEEKYGETPEEPKPQSAPRALNQVTAVFKRWLAIKNTIPLHAMLGSIAANLLPGDPIWLGLIAPSSNAKTELLNALARLPYVQSIEALTPAALLSGTPRRQKEKGATGGLLRQLGDFEIIVLKDFSTVLDMKIETRAEMMAALRRIFDGEYTRPLGTDGGKILKWSGKAGFLFAATPKYDLYHSVVGSLGDRFLLTRVEGDNDEQFEKCFHHLGSAAKVMRDELADAVAGLFSGLPDPLPEPDPMTAAEIAELRKVVMLAIYLRAGVERDRIRRDIEAVYDPEGPARLALTLARLFAGPSQFSSRSLELLFEPLLPALLSQAAARSGKRSPVEGWSPK